MSISYRGIEIIRSNSDGQLHYQIGDVRRGPFEHYQDAQDDIERTIEEMGAQEMAETFDTSARAEEEAIQGAPSDHVMANVRSVLLPPVGGSS